jgi:hypothetical protein
VCPEFLATSKTKFRQYLYQSQLGNFDEVWHCLRRVALSPLLRVQATSNNQAARNQATKQPNQATKQPSSHATNQNKQQATGNQATQITGDQARQTTDNQLQAMQTTTANNPCLRCLVA